MTNDALRRRRAAALASQRRHAPPASVSAPTDVRRLLLGWPPFWDQPHADLRAWSIAAQQEPDLTLDIRASLDVYLEKPTPETAAGIADAYAASAVDEHCSDWSAAADRVRLVAGLMGHVPSALAASLHAESEAGYTDDDAQRRAYLTTAAELRYLAFLGTTVGLKLRPTRTELREAAWKEMRATAELVSFWDALERDAAAAGPRSGPVRDDTGWDPDDLPDFFDDRQEPDDRVVVLAALTTAGRKEALKEVAAVAKGLVDTPLLLRRVPDDWTAWTVAIDHEFPHASAVTRAIASAQGNRSTWGGPILCLRGDPGAGKSRYVRRVAEISGLGLARYACDLSSDNSFAGTPARWLTGCPALPAIAMRDLRTANPVIHLDELEKASGSRGSNGGRLHDALVSMWETETACAWRDPFFEAPVDLSNILWWVTVNDVAGIPAPLLDRMRVIDFPLPGPEHLDVLVAQIARDACRDQGLDEAWSVMDPEEMASIRAHWPGGSLRRLRRLVDVVLTSRDVISPRH